MRHLLFIPLGSVIALSAQAYDQIPKEDGLSGNVSLGVTSDQMKTNQIATVTGTHVSDKNIDSLSGSPDSKSYTKVVPAFGLSYTLAGSLTQFFAGTAMEDFINEDSVIDLGVRQGIGDPGNLRFSLLGSTPQEVWKDPYVTGADRKTTDRTSNGFRLGWENIFQSDFDVTYTQRKIDLDHERSGTALGLSQDQQDLLDRNGKDKKLDVSYRWQIDKDNILTPTLSYIDRDLDGNAMKMDGYQADLGYSYLGLQGWQFGADAFGGHLKSDHTNPIYDQKQSVDRYGMSLSATYLEPFGLKDWSARAAVNYGEENSNIDFYDTRLGSVSVGMSYNF